MRMENLERGRWEQTHSRRSLELGCDESSVRRFLVVGRRGGQSCRNWLSWLVTVLARLPVNRVWQLLNPNFKLSWAFTHIHLYKQYIQIHVVSYQYRCTRTQHSHTVGSCVRVRSRLFELSCVCLKITCFFVIIRSFFSVWTWASRMFSTGVVLEAWALSPVYKSGFMNTV